MSCVSQNMRRSLLCVGQQCPMWDLLLAAERLMLCWMFRTSLSSEKYQFVPIQGGCSRLSPLVLTLRETGLEKRNAASEGAKGIAVVDDRADRSPSAAPTGVVRETCSCSHQNAVDVDTKREACAGLELIR